MPARTLSASLFTASRPIALKPRRSPASSGQLARQQPIRRSEDGGSYEGIEIDELPQLFNVVKGEMSLVGPRPTLMDQVEAYDDFRRQRLLVRPGISGLAQVYGNAMVSWDERILYDIAYVRHCSFGLDLHVLMRTMLVVIGGERGMTRAFAESRFARFVTPPMDYGEDR